MGLKNRLLFSFVVGFFMMVSITLLCTPIVEAQYWAALPPYNTLWPLWSPPLSPTNPLTGLPTPIVSNLSPNTVLPVQPALTWDPYQDEPWLLYNTPIGMAYYDPLYGVEMWPPKYLKDPITGLANTLDLSLLKEYYTALAPIKSDWIAGTLPIANNAFINSYPAFAVAYETLAGGTLANYPIFGSLLNPSPPLQSLLTPALMLGLGPLLP